MTHSTPRDRLHSWIKTEHLFEEVNDTIVAKSIKSILNLFTSHKQLLHFIINHATKQKLDCIHDILKQEQEQFRENEINVISIQSKPLSSFDKISKESVSNICSFLDRGDILQMKETSRRIALVCLEEMAKYSIGMCHASPMMHSVINETEDIEWVMYLSYNRYNIATNYNSLFENAENRYYLPIKYQIPIAMHLIQETFTFVSDKYDRIKAKESLVLFDKREITVLTSESCRNMTENDTFDPKNNKLLSLHYFNLKKQQIENVTCVCIDQSINRQMLENYILSVSDLQTSNLKLYGNVDMTMDAYSECEEIQNEFNFSEFSSIYVSIIFHQNPDINPEYWGKVKKDYEISHLKFAHFQFDDYMHYLSEIEDEDIQGRVREMTIDFEYDGDLNILKPNIRQKLHNFEEELQLTLDSNIETKKIKQFIAKKLDDIISYKNIELFYEGWGSKSKHILHRTLFNLFYEYSCPYFQKLFFEIVSYNTETKDDNLTVFRANIYSAEQSPFPYNATQGSPSQITLKLRPNASVNDYINYLILKMASGPLIYQHLQPSLNEYISFAHPLCYPITSKSDTVFIKDPERNINCYGNDDHKVIEFTLYMISNKMNNESRNIPLTVRFALHSEFNKDVHINSYYLYQTLIGLPLIVWINKEDTMEHVMNDEIVQQYHQDIVQIYRVDKALLNVTGIDREDTIKLMPKNGGENYKIYENILGIDANNFIVITLNKNENVNLDFSQRFIHNTI